MERSAPLPSEPHNMGSFPDNTDNIELAAMETTRSEREMSDVDQEESMAARIERMGRERPAVFKSLWAEAGFVFTISMSQVLTEYFVSGFTVVLPTLAEKLDIPDASRTWPASAFSLTLAATLLFFGRLADMYGGYPCYLAGLLWLSLWSLIAGFSKNELMLDFCRALQGLGPAAFLPSSMMLLGSIYRPGPRKNLVFSIYGASAPAGFFVGIFFAGVTGEYTSWGWYFWIGTILTLITTITAYTSIPSDMEERRGLGIKMDWVGTALILSGLILLTFSVIDSSHAPQQWKTPYIYLLFVGGSLLLIAAAYYEWNIASDPLLPASLFKIPQMPALMFALSLTYGSLGIFLLYATFYMESILGGTPLQIVAWYVPMALGGCIISTIGGLVLHLLPGSLLVLIAGTAWIVAPLLFAISPVGANYWAYIFPAMICATIGIDITFSVANIFITTSLPRAQQGLAGAIIMILLHLSIALFLGFADIVNTYTLERLGERKSYKAVFWLEVACAGIALVVLVLFVKIKKAESALTVDEMAELEREAAVGTEELKQKEAKKGKEDRAAGEIDNTS